MLKRMLLFPYHLIRWVILLSIALSLLLLFLIEKPSLTLALIKKPLQEQGIEYGSITGGILSGFTLHDVNYQNKAKAKEVTLKVNLDQLENRLLYIEDLSLDGIEIQKGFLKSLIENNRSEETQTKEKHALPFDKIIIQHANITLHNIAYQNYVINSAKLEVKNLSSDMKKQYKGDLHLLLDSNVTQLDLNGSINNENITIIADVVPNRNFILTKITDKHIKIANNPHFTLKANGDMHKINYQLLTHYMDIQYDKYTLESQKLKLTGSYHIDNKDLQARLNSDLVGNMATLQLNSDATFNIEDINNTLHYTLNADLTPKASFLSTLLQEQNITVERSPQLHLSSQGDFKKLNYHLTIKALKLKQKEHQLHKGFIELLGEYSITQHDLVATLKSDIESSPAKLSLHAKTALNLKDINQTLSFETTGELRPKRLFLNQLLKEQNITLQGQPILDFEAKGKLNELHFVTDLKGLQLHKDDLNLLFPKLSLQGKSDLLQGASSIHLASNLKSSAGLADLLSQTEFNFKDINHTLKTNSELNLQLNAAYLNGKLKDQNISIEGTPKIHLTAKGGLANLGLQIDAKTKLRNEGNLSKITLQSSPISVDIFQHNIAGSLTLHSDAQHIGLALESHFKGDYTQPKAIETNTDLQIKNFNAFGINLTPLVPLKLHLQSAATGAKLSLNSKRIQAHADTKDYDQYRFDLQSKNLYLYKMISLPSQLDHKFIKVDLKGSATLSKEYFDIKGVLHSNKQFKANVTAQNSASGLHAKLQTQHLLLTAKGDLKKRNIHATLTVDALDKLQKELNALYAFETINVTGRLQADAKMHGEKIHLSLQSPKLKFKDFNIEELDIDANYNKTLLTLNRFRFNTTRFKDKALNKQFYLNQKGRIYLGAKRDIIIDMHPDINIRLRGNQENLQGKISIKKLPLGHPAYGSLILTTDIDYLQEGEKKSITGDVILKKMKLFYEAKFLDPANDPDVVIITKKDKKIKEASKDAFLNNTSIDLNIKAPQANYKTPDINLLFDVKLRANKAFGQELALLGKIQDINGHVDQVPKRFKVVNSTIVFKGEPKINPLLDLHVEYELPQVMIYITIGGDANHPKLEFTSEPPMPKKDIMSYLLFGVSTASLAEGEGSLSREAELFILNQAARDLAYELGLDRIFIKDDGTGEGFAIEAGKKISAKNMVIIESSKEGNSFILEHTINKNIKLRIGQHQKEIPSQSIDIYFRKKFR